MPTKERVADMTVTTTQLAAVLGITNRRVQQLTQAGPHQAESRSYAQSQQSENRSS